MAGDILLEDALAVFSLAPGFSEGELRASFIRLAKIVHPDHGGSQELFRTVKECHSVLERDAASRFGAPRPHHVLRETFRSEAHAGPPSRDMGSESGRGFDASRFNALFEEFHVRDEIETGGYESEMRQDDGGRTMPKLDPDKCNADAFNRAFEATVRAEEPTETAIVVHPHPGNSSSSLSPCEIGLCRLDSYEVWLPSGIGAYDCKLAYSGRSAAASRGGASRESRAPASDLDLQAVTARRETDLGRAISEEEARAYREHEEAQRRVDALRSGVQATRDLRMAKSVRAATALALGY